MLYCTASCLLLLRPNDVLACIYLQAWRYEGSNTLAYYLRRRDALRALARDMGVDEGIVVPVAMRQLLLGLAALHSTGEHSSAHSTAPLLSTPQHHLALSPT
jgi:hypothetical protein